MAANIRCIMRAKAPYGQGITKMKVKLTPEQSSTPSLMPETESVYLRRATEGTGELMELVGGTVAWNQLFSMNASSYTQSNVQIVSDGNGGFTYSGTTNATTPYTDVHTSSVMMSRFIVGHRYLLTCNSTDNKLYVVVNQPYTDMNNLGRRELIYTPTATPTYFIVRLKATNGETVNGSGVVHVVDLTQFFNPTIADYVYSLEQSTAGSGIAWLQSYGFFTEDYIPYSAPTLQSVEVSAHVTKDANNTIIDTYPLDSDLVFRDAP